MGYTRDYRVKYHYAHAVGTPDGKPVDGVLVVATRDLAFAKAEEVMRASGRHNLSAGAEVIHVNPDNGGRRSVIAFYGRSITQATRWEVALYPDGKGPEIVHEQHEIDARETASRFARNDQGVATIYRIVKNLREQVAVIVPPHADEIAEAHRINDALNEVEFGTSSRQEVTAMSPKTLDRVTGPLADFGRDFPHVDAALTNTTPEVAPAPVSATSWTTDVQAAAKLAETLGTELGTSIARLLDQVAHNAREGRTPTVVGELAVCVRRLAEAVTATAERNAALPRVLVSPDRTLAAIEREPEHAHGGRFRVTNGGRYQSEHVLGWDELGVI